MKPEDFRMTSNGRRTIYEHIENGKKREEIFRKRMSGDMSQEEFASEQKGCEKEDILNTYIHRESI